MSYGAIHFWTVKADEADEHARVINAIVRAEREYCPEVLANLVLGPSASGQFAEVQIYSDKAACDGFADRVAREVAPLQRLWERHGRLVEPDASRSLYFDANAHLPESFVRAGAQIGQTGGRTDRLAGKVALVTGATRGNGFGIARALAAQCADVILTDLPALTAETERSAARIQGEHGGGARRCVALAADVTDEAAVAELVRATVEQMGGLDILVNNAGVFPFKPIGEFTADEFSRVLAVNVTGPWLLCKYALPHLRARGGGAVVNVTSCSGHYGGASSGGSAYDASKAALRQMTTSLAVEWGPLNIRVNAIAPGVIATEAQGGAEMLTSAYGRSEIARTPLGRVGNTDDVGALAAFLASDDAAFITGISVILDGGAMAAW